MPRKYADVERNITKKGFQKTESDHHFYTYYTTTNLRTAIRTKMSHSNRGASDISDTLISVMARQCCLSRADFCKFIDCSLSQVQYEQILLDVGKIKPEDIN